MDFFKKGNEHLLKKTKWGIVASRAVRPEITRQILKAVDTMNEIEETFISGWHSPIEKEIHLYLVRRTFPHIHAEAKGLPHAGCPLGGEDVLFVTHCDDSVDRITRKHALRRNRLICSLADRLIVPWLDPDRETFDIVSKTCSRKPVYVFEYDNGKSLLDAGARLFKELSDR